MYQRCGNPQFMGEAECGSGRYKLSCFERVGGDRSDRFGGPLDSAFRERCGAYVTEQAGGLLHSRLNFNIHNKAHIARAAQEGIVFSFKYGMDIMNEMGIDIGVIRAGNANLFLSPIFRDALAGVTGTVIELTIRTGLSGLPKAPVSGPASMRRRKRRLLP